jgi:hypothetical protein
VPAHASILGKKRERKTGMHNANLRKNLIELLSLMATSAYFKKRLDPHL